MNSLSRPASMMAAARSAGIASRRQISSVEECPSQADKNLKANAGSTPLISYLYPSASRRSDFPETDTRSTFRIAGRVRRCMPRAEDGRAVSCYGPSRSFSNDTDVDRVGGLAFAAHADSNVRNFRLLLDDRHVFRPTRRDLDDNWVRILRLWHALLPRSRLGR